jgi:hypothetical protein
VVHEDPGVREALAECVASLGLEVATAADAPESPAAAPGGRQHIVLRGPFDLDAVAKALARLLPPA